MQHGVSMRSMASAAGLYSRNIAKPFPLAFEQSQMQAYCEDGKRCRHAQLLEYFGEAWGVQHGWDAPAATSAGCGDSCDVCCGTVRVQQGSGNSPGVGSKRSGRAKSGTRGSGAPTAGFQPASVLLSQHPQQQGRQQPAGSARALKMQQAAVQGGGWRTKKSGKEAQAGAPAAAPVFQTAAQLAKQQQQSGASGGGSKACKAGSGAAAGKKNGGPLDLLFAKANKL